MQERLSGGEALFVGADVQESEGYVMKIVRALRGAGALVIILGLAGGVLISRNVSRSMQGLVDVVNAVRAGDLHAWPVCAARATNTTNWPRASTTCSTASSG